MLSEGKVFGSGSTGIADQTPVFNRYTKHNALAIADVGGHFYEYAIRGKAWYVNTAATGITFNTSIGTTAGFCLFNAKGSGVNVIVLFGSIGYVSGTLGAGFYAWCTNVNLAEAIPTGTAIVARPALVGGASPAGGTALTTATLAATPNIARVFGNSGAFVGGANNIGVFNDLVDGALVLPPGGSVSIQGTTGSATSPLLVGSVLFAEEPI